MKIKEITSYLEDIAPISLQESYDNSGLIVGNPNTEVTGVLTTLDATESIIDEAIKKDCNLIVAHHPILFFGLKRLNGNSYVERTIIKAIQNNIAIYAIHTNLDNVANGVNAKICNKLELEETKILAPGKEKMMKIVTFVPKENASTLLEALTKAGAGKIGNYDSCSFQTEGKGTFKGNPRSNPTIGEKNNLEFVDEIKLEMVFPSSKKGNVLNALTSSHPYDEVAYDIISLDNINKDVGSGMIGVLKEKMNEDDFFIYLKEKMNLKGFKHTNKLSKPIKKVAVCGGAGSFLLRKALTAKADIFITSDFKYHEFFDAEEKIIIADIGHFESETYTRDLLADMVSEISTNTPIHISTTNTNPVQYFF